MNILMRPRVKLLVVLWLVVWSPVGWTWDCGAYNQQTAVEDYVLVFDGTVESIEPVEIDGEVAFNRVHFVVEGVLHGEAVQRVVVETGPFLDSPGYPFLCGERYRVFADYRGGAFYTEQCMPVRPLARDVMGAGEIEELLWGDAQGREAEREATLGRMSCPR